MSESNIEFVKRFYELFSTGDIEAIIAAHSEYAVWDHSGPPGNPANRVFEGHAGLREFFKILDETQEVLEFEVNDHVGSGDRVVSLGFMRLRVKATGKAWESDWATAWTIKEGLITHWKVYFDMSAEVAAFQD